MKEQVMKGPLWNFDSGFCMVSCMVSDAGLGEHSARPGFKANVDPCWNFSKRKKPSEIWDHRPALERFLREAGGKAEGSFKILWVLSSLLLFLEWILQICR